MGSPSLAGRYIQMPNVVPQPKRFVSPPLSILSSPPTHTHWKFWMQLRTENKTIFSMYTRDCPAFQPPTLHTGFKRIMVTGIRMG